MLPLLATDDLLGFYCSVIRTEFSNMHANCFIAFFPNSFPTILNVSRDATLCVYNLPESVILRCSINTAKIPLAKGEKFCHSNYLKTLLEILKQPQTPCGQPPTPIDLDLRELFSSLYQM